MAHATRIKYNGNLNTATDYKPVMSGVTKSCYLGTTRIYNWRAATQRPTSAMTSNSAPSPLVASADSEYSSSYAAYLAFNKSYSTDYGWASASAGSTHWLMIKMDKALKDIVVTIRNRTRSSMVAGPIAGRIEGSDDGSNFTTIGTFSGKPGSTSAAGWSVSCDNYNDAYQYVRLYVTSWDTSGGNAYVAVGEMYVDGDEAY